MATFAQFKTSIIKNYELIVKTLTRKLKDGSIIVGHATNAENAINAVSADTSVNSANADNAAKLEGKTIAEILLMVKSPADNSFETLSNNLRDYNGELFYRPNGKIDKIIYQVENYTFEKVFKYRPDGRPEKVIFRSSDFDLSTILANNCKTLVYDSNDKLTGKQYSFVI